MARLNLDEIYTPDDSGTQIRALDTGGAVRNVKAWGAVGDGMADDTEALQDTIDAGGHVVIPPGVYRTTAELTVPNNTRISGSGNPWSYQTGRSDTVILYDGATDADTSVLRVSTEVPEIEPMNARSNVHVSGITLDADSKAGYGLYAAYVTNDSVFQDITVLGATEHGARFEKVWYARIEGIIARGNPGCGITIGRSDWGGVNGVGFRYMRAHSCGSDKAFNAASNYEWGYGIGFYPGSGCLLDNVVAEANDGPGLLIGMGSRSSNEIRGVYLENNGTSPRTEGRSPRNYGIIVKGSSNARAMELRTVYQNGTIGGANAQSIWLTGDEPTGALVIRNVSYGHYLDADWDNYILEGYIYGGLAGNRADMKPAFYHNVLFSQEGVNLRFTSSIDDCKGPIDAEGRNLAVFFIPSADAAPSVNPAVRLRNLYSTGVEWVNHTFEGPFTAGQLYISNFNSGSLGQSVRMGEVIGTAAADVDCFGTVGVIARRQDGFRYEF